MNKIDLKKELKMFLFTFVVSFFALMLLIVMIFFIAIFVGSNKYLAYALMVIVSILTAIYLKFIFDRTKFLSL